VACVAQQPQTAFPAQPAAQHDARDVNARMDLEESRRRGFTVAAPAYPPLPSEPAIYPVPATGAVFAAPDGDPAAAGSTDRQPTTLQNALKIAPAGGTVVLHAGTYRVGGLILPRQISLQPAAGASVWLKGSDVLAGWQKDGNAWRRAWKQFFPPRGYNATVMDNIIEPTHPLAAHSDQVFIGGQALFPVATREEVGPGKFFADQKNLQIFIGEDPAGREVEATSREWGLLATRRGVNDSSGSTVQGINFAHYADAGLLVSAPDVTVQDCGFAWNAGNGVNFHPWSTGVQAEDPRNCVLRRCTSTGNGSSGASVGHAENLLVEGNTFSYNNTRGFKRSWSAAGIKIIFSPNIVVRDNLVEHNFATGIWMDIDVNRALVHHNLVRHNNGLGIFFEISDECLIAWNTVHDNDTGIQVSNSTRARVWNNTLWNNDKSLYVQWWKRAQHEGDVVAGIRRGGEYLTRDNTFHNNLVVVSQKKALVLEAEGGAEKSSRRLSESDHNAYFLSGEGAQTPFARWARDGGEPKSYASLDEFRVDEPSYERNAVVASGNPFVDAAGGDFRLKPLFAFVGRGAHLSADAKTPLPDDVAKLRRAPQIVPNMSAR
jgi:hypothetical protein